MNSPVYFPRLPKLAARQLLEEFSVFTVPELRHRAEVNLETSFFYPSAPTGQHVSTGVLEELQVKIRGIATDNGYPSDLSQKDPRKTKFDRDVVAQILDIAPLIPAEASVEDVWSFISLVLLPDVAFWRWPNSKRKEDYERILGYPRNVFRRLWWRAYILGSGPDAVSNKIYEDEAVAILERSLIGGNRQVARIIAETHIKQFAGEKQRTNVMRDAMKRIRRLHAFVSFHSIHEAEIRQLVEQAFSDAAASLRK